MACCAFAAFLISQLILGMDWAIERLGLAKGHRPTANAVVGWRLGAAVTLEATPARRSGLNRRLGMAAVAGVMSFTVLAGLTLREEAASNWRAGLLICTSHGLQSLTSLLRGPQG